MNILEEMYYRNIDPCEWPVVRTKEDKEILSQVVHFENSLLETLNAQQKEFFEKYQWHHDKLWTKEGCRAFENGFRVGAQIMQTINKNIYGGNENES